MVSKANRELGLLKKNFSACSSRTKEKLYLSFVRPKLDYSCEVWSPSSKELKRRLEIVQRNAARFDTNNHSQRSSVTDNLAHLNWETLESRRTRLQLKLLHKMFTFQVALKLFDSVQINNCRNLRNSHSKRPMPKFARVDVVKHSLFYCVIPKWNSLPEHLVNQTNSDIFFDLFKTHFSEN